MIRIFKTEGNSLYPHLKEGQRIICLKVFKFSKIKVDDFVVFSKSPYGLMIKRVKSIKDERYFVQGTDPMSIDSRNFGLIGHADIHYKKLLYPSMRKLLIAIIAIITLLGIYEFNHLASQSGYDAESNKNEAPLLKGLHASRDVNKDGLRNL